jgi:hypothetical protein
MVINRFLERAEQRDVDDLSVGDDLEVGGISRRLQEQVGHRPTHASRVC